MFAAIATILGDRVRRVPDGETGPRLNWIEGQAPIFDNHPMFERGEEGANVDWRNKNVDDARRTKGWHVLRPGVAKKDLVFGPLGYASAAKASFKVFARLKRGGIVHSACRFQVSLPTPYNVIDQRIAPAFRLDVEGPYERRMLAEIDEMAAEIPHGELSIQWDVAHEMQNLDGGRPHWFDNPEEGILERLVRLGTHIPAGIELGYHLCYGDLRHKHFIEPKDTGLMVRVANALSRAIARPIHWIHMPVPRDRTDDAYFAPLKGLRLRPETRLYLGLVHFTDGVAGARKRLDAAKKVVRDFGVATECGLGRRPPETIPQLLRIHAEISEIEAQTG